MDTYYIIFDGDLDSPMSETVTYIATTQDLYGAYTARDRDAYNFVAYSDPGCQHIVDQMHLMLSDDFDEDIAEL